MIDYGFDESAGRAGTGCVKWDEPTGGLTADEMADVVPMWVADMDFRTAPAITDALRRRVEHGVFGYTHVGDDYYDAVVGWYRRRHAWTDLRREHIMYTQGVVPAISCVLKAVTMPGEKVLVQTPVYNCFFSCVHNSGCEVLENRLLRYDIDGTNEFSYRVDWDDFERKCADPKCTVFLMCNPHNPAGVAWSEDDLRRMGAVCRANGVMVLSDEIHGELGLNGVRYKPYGTLGRDFFDGSVVVSSPSKAFNTAGLQMANIFCSDAALRYRIDRAININEVCDVNAFAPIAVMAAYNEGEPWLDEVCKYIYGNYEALCRFMSDEMPWLRHSRLQATYLVWVDIGATGMGSDEVADRLLHEGRVRVSSGTIYGGEGYVRLNIACPRTQMMEGLRRMAATMKKIMADK